MTGKEMLTQKLNTAQDFNSHGRIDLNPSEKSDIQACEIYCASEKFETINVYPLHRAVTGKPGGELIGVTELCAQCGGTHTFGLSANPLRVLHGRTFLLLWQPVPVPEDLAWAIRHEPENVLFWAERLAPRPMSHGGKMLGLRDVSENLRKRSPVSGRTFSAAVQNLVDSGVFDDRCGRLTADAPELVGPVYRSLVAEFIRRQPGDSMRARLSRALTAAAKLCARGDFA